MRDLSCSPQLIPLTKTDTIKAQFITNLTIRLKSFQLILNIIFYYNLSITSFSLEVQCDKWKCPGPLFFYQTLNCTPVYKTDDCCADYYNCDHLFKRIPHWSKIPDKCYYNGQEYRVEDSIRNEDITHCLNNCVCHWSNADSPTVM